MLYDKCSIFQGIFGNFEKKRLSTQLFDAMMQSKSFLEKAQMNSK